MSKWKKVYYKWTNKEDLSKTNNNYNNEEESVIFEEDYDFEDWLMHNGVISEKENNTYYVIDEEGKRTGEAFITTKIIKIGEGMDFEYCEEDGTLIQGTNDGWLFVNGECVNEPGTDEQLDKYAADVMNGNGYYNEDGKFIRTGWGD